MITEWLYYKNVLSPVVFLSFVTTLLCCFILSPILMNLVAPMRTFGKKKVYMHTFLGSTIHAIVSCTNSVLVLSQGDLAKDKLFAVNSAGVTSLHITVGYILGDTLVCLMDPYLRRSYSTLLHHLAMITGVLLCLYHERFLFFVIYHLFSELSTPFVNWRGVLHELGDRNSWWYAMAALGMMISFFLCRVLVIPWHNYVLFAALLSTEASTVPLYLKMILVLNSVPFDFLNSFWFYKMFKGARKYFFHIKVSTK